MKPLGANLSFHRHNLVTDQSSGDFHLILCRNVLIYFNPDLQGRVLDLFHSSLVGFGMLALGSKESLRCAPHQHSYREVSGYWRIFQKIK